MTTEACMLALKSTLEEIKNVCPEVSNTFIFTSNQTVMAKDAATEETTLAEDSVKAFAALNGKAQGAGGLETATFLGANSQVKIVRANNMFFAVVAKRSADEKTLTVIARVLAPAVLKTIQSIQPELAGDQTESLAMLGGESSEASVTEAPAVIEAESSSNAVENQENKKAMNDPYVPDAPVTQFMVETLHSFNRLMGAPDYVRVDSKTLEAWRNLFGDRKIEEVQIEDTGTGKKQRFKFKPIKDDKLQGKGIIQIPEKAQVLLKTKKGALVMVKPIIE